MTFDDGMLKIYELRNTAENGLKPELKLFFKEEYYFRFDLLGINRYYTALQAKTQLSHVVNVPDWPDIVTDDIAILEDEKVYRIAMVQPQYDEYGIKITKLSLERIIQEYAIAEQTA